MQAAVWFLFVFLAGSGINVHESGKPIESLGDAGSRIAADVKEGYSKDTFTSFKLND